MFRRKRVLDGVVRKKFLINLKTGALMSGLLVDHDDLVLAFAHVKVKQGDAWEPAADGLVYLFVADVESLQKVSVADAPQ